MKIKSASLDPVTVQILRNRIGSLTDEMHYHFFRSGYSTIVRESRDFSCVILDPKGRILVAPPMFFHSTAYKYLVQRIYQIYGIAGLQDGDVFISNHPYEGNLPHVPDMGVVMPIFQDRVLVGFSGSIAHKADLGGTIPGSTWGQATEIFQEGILYPPIRYYRSGMLNLDIERLIYANSRFPETTLGDLHGQVAAIDIGRQRLQNICEEHSSKTVLECMDAMVAAAATEFRIALGKLPEGRAEAESFLDSDGVNYSKAIRIHVSIMISNGKVIFDFSNSDLQGRGPVNIRRGLLEACCFQVLIGMMDPDLRYSDAAFDTVHIKTRTGTVVDPESPAPCSSYMKTCMTVIDMLIEAFGKFVPQRAAAYSGGSGGGLTINWTGKGRVPRGNQYEIFGSAYGGSASQDGTSGTTVHLSNIYITPIEIVETEFPCLVTRFELIAGSGGDGRFRGGLSVRRNYKLLESATIIFRGDRAQRPPKGLAGGKPGRASRFLINPNSSDEQEMPITTTIDLEAGASISIEAAGGGGYGNPMDRTRTNRRRDLEQKYV